MYRRVAFEYLLTTQGVDSLPNVRNLFLYLNILL